MRMRYFSIAILFLVVCGFQQLVSAQNVFTPAEIKWGAPPPFLAAGAQIAVLEGDPMASSGDFTIRIKMPSGYKIAPHSHPKRENVTVISGSFKVGMGDKVEAGKMKLLPAGSFAYMEPGMNHYAMAVGPTVVQVHGMSPLQINYVNVADDPSKK